MLSDKLHRLLSRQLRRALFVPDADALTAVLEELACVAQKADLSPKAITTLTGLGELLRQIDETYCQNDRDLELSQRSLDISSQELFVANSRLRLSERALADRAEWLAAEVAKATSDLARQEMEAIVVLARAAEFRDPETGGHIMRMAHYSRLIAIALGLSESDQNLLLTAAPMHDVGKVGIFDSILLKPGKLEPDEFEEMKKHARIVAVADVFDALTSERPYKKAWSLEDARNFIAENSGSHFDPDCVAAFIAQWEGVLVTRKRFSD